MGNMLGGGDSGGGGGVLGGLLGGLGGGGSGGGGFLSSLLGGLPDPLGLGKMLGITHNDPSKDQAAPQNGPPPPASVQFAPQAPASGVSINPEGMYNSPVSPAAFRIGGGK